MVNKVANLERKYPFENLVLSGGGIWGLAYAGSAQVLAEEGIYDAIRRVAGVSSGAIFAALMCLGYEPDDMVRILYATEFHSFEDKPNFFRLFSKYSMFAGDAILAWLHKLVAESPAGGGNPDLTFRELSKKGTRELYVFATDLNTQTYQEFSARTQPDMKVAEAVRASVSLPMFFKAWRFPDADQHRNLYCDGGMMNNYPLDFFDNPFFCSKSRLANERTLGFLFLAPRTNADRPNDGLVYGELHAYLKALLEAIIIGVIGSIQSTANIERTVLTPVHETHISPIHFKVNNEQIAKLIQVGRESLQSYLKQYYGKYAAWSDSQSPESEVMVKSSDEGAVGMKK